MMPTDAISFASGISGEPAAQVAEVAAGAAASAGAGGAGVGDAAAGEGGASAARAVPQAPTAMATQNIPTRTVLMPAPAPGRNARTGDTLEPGAAGLNSPRPAPGGDHAAFWASRSTMVTMSAMMRFSSKFLGV